MERPLLHPIQHTPKVPGRLPTRKPGRRLLPDRTCLGHRRHRTRRRHVPRVHRPRQTTRPHPPRARTPDHLHLLRRLLTHPVLGNRMVALPTIHQSQVSGRPPARQTHRRRTVGLRHRLPHLLRDHGGVAKQIVRRRLPDLPLGCRNQRRPTFPPRPRLRPQMAGTPRSQHRPPHHQPQQTRRKPWCRSAPATAVAHRPGPPPLHA